MPACLIMTSLPDKPAAENMAKFLVESRLAACVQILPIQSFYIWQARLNNDAEFLLLIKTRAELYAPVEQAIRTRHPYEVPEIVKLPIAAGLPAYLDWIKAGTQD